MQHQKQSKSVALKSISDSQFLANHVQPAISYGRRKLIRYGLLAVNAAILMSVAALIISNRSRAAVQSSSLNLGSDVATSTNPLDTISSADIAVNIAYLTGLPQTTAVENHADSASTHEDIVPSGAQAIAKPQIVVTDLKSKQDIQPYVVVEGDTVDSVSQKFGVSSKSVQWSNNLTGTTLSVGSTIFIPPVEGIVHTVAAGDTVDSLATRFRADKARIVAFNDAEISGLIQGERVVIPDGEIPVPVGRRFIAGASAAAGFRATYGPANGYDFGWCTWHAANRRREIGNPIPTNLGNAVTWSARARAAGMGVSDTPIAGAVVWHDQSQSGYVAGGLGHVAYVESVNADGSIIVSDMNSRGVANPDLTGPPAGGWSRISYRLVTPDQFYRYDFIY